MQLENTRQNVPVSDYSKFRDDTRSEIDKMKQDPNNYPMKEIIQISSQLDQKILKIQGDEAKPQDIETNVEET